MDSFREVSHGLCFFMQPPIEPSRVAVINRLASCAQTNSALHRRRNYDAIQADTKRVMIVTVTSPESSYDAGQG